MTNFSADERSALFRELTTAAQETRLLLELTESISANSAAGEIVQQIEYAIRTVLPLQAWRRASLALLDDSGRELRIYEMAGGDVSRYWENVHSGALAAGNDLGVTVEFVVGGATGPGSQRVRLDEALAARVDGIALAPIDAADLEPGIVVAAANGVPLITFDSPPLPGSAALAYVGTNNRAAGRLAGDAMQRLLPAGGLVAVSVDSLRAVNGAERVAGFAEWLAGDTYTLLPTIEEEYDPVRGRALAAETLQRQPELAGAFGACGFNGPNWGATVEAAGRSGQVKIVAFDISASSVDLLMNGVVAAVIAQREFEMAYRSIELLCHQIVDGAIPDLPPTRVFDTRVDVVTLDRTPWSIALPDYIRAQLVRRPPDMRLRAAIALRRAPITIRMIGMAETGAVAPREETQPLNAQSPIGRAFAAGRTLVGDPSAADTTSAMRTQIIAPLITQGQALGALMFESERPDACSPEDLALIERVARIVAVALDRARLLRQSERRATELAEAGKRQEALLETILELSSPVVPIAQGILIVPLVGALDSHRAARLLDTLLSEISARRAEVVLIDITGVPVVDTAVAHALLQTARAAQLLGAEVVLVGITSAVAQTIVHLGVQFADMTTRADLASGFSYALARRGGRIAYRDVK